MKVKITMDWGGHKAGELYECDDGEGCQMIGTGVAVPVELDPPPKEDRKTKRQRIEHRRRIAATMPEEKV